MWIISKWIGAIGKLCKFAIVVAIGVSNTYIASSEILAIHFEKYKYLAFALAVLGYYFGMVAWPTLSQHLLDKFGYSTTMGIISSLHIIHIITGCLFFQPTERDIDLKTDTINGKYIILISMNNGVLLQLRHSCDKKMNCFREFNKHTHT